ncbi:hypothetical protein O181_067888 [Austropuccinia psidii MF-1]|uniref:Uncharacterized protein n=1 Tax=Austropuccinia psidii MF-1 TaxID=1389203 RepID=A0A9Q3I4Y7_9BASI|nr:hypothetical protein [Austropuccinia psidii MF-1]
MFHVQATSLLLRQLTKGSITKYPASRVSIPETGVGRRHGFACLPAKKICPAPQPTPDSNAMFVKATKKAVGAYSTACQGPQVTTRRTMWSWDSTGSTQTFGSQQIQTEYNLLSTFAGALSYVHLRKQGLSSVALEEILMEYAIDSKFRTTPSGRVAKLPCGWSAFNAES